MQTQKTTEAKFRERIKESGMRMSDAKLLIFKLLLVVEGPVSAQEIVQKVPNVHYVSIYRSLDVLRKAGVVVQVPQRFKNLFELSDLFRPHHHHATCKVCGTTKEVHDDRIESLMNKLTKEAGLEPTEHHFELYGVCKSCQTEPKESR